MADWTPDVLGDEFEQLTLDLGADDQGPVVATLVRALPAEPGWWDRVRRRAPQLDGVDVLYVHGWSDYFFQKRLARFWTSRGARFFALDLRKYGRSLREGQTPGYVADLATYDEDIAAALTEMGRGEGGGESDRRLVLLGHSTGGLTLSLWASRHPGVADAVILNSPWLEFQFAPARAAIAPMVELQARIRPLEAAPQVDLGFYTRAQQEVADPDDPMEVNPLWRPVQTMAVYAGWLHAILSGHKTVAGGLSITAPVCVLLSARFVPPTRWSEELTSADSVLVVDDIARAALRLGSTVTVERIDGALHDVFLSRHEAREDAYRRLDRWVTGWRAAD
ncbi:MULTISPECIES: alpha/beta hydrolase [Microbacterium]|uniref:alpha/beta hydrolase n=1 Tax=Microbacterium TaxID=33882 RepID=UPI000CCABE34|nr:MULTISPECIES: alpha/beta hydrolase [Microbacterium]PKQ34550.1 MAG: alpha/beta hydrolase [Actinobacteria bacterium HGW-Actinobacteria-11]MCK8478518.1 alpha/beta hydrolase [Microbacterium aurugineum]MCZ4302298.1 alpha/beta hydrolase [Microbacterium oxydans]QEA27251.1 alpha/beta hydrolase [Microbacterium sp. CBA3102]TFB15822.1 alpha/beta hydrolase [Microbacterium sp. 3H14]